MTNPVMNSQNFQQQMSGGQQQPGWYSNNGQQTQERGQSRFGQGLQEQYAGTQYGRQQSQPNLEEMYNAPAANAGDTGRMTYNDIIGKTGMTLTLVVLGAAVGWMFPGIGIFGAIVGLVLGLVNAFKKEPSPALILAYAGAQGLFLGAISMFMESMYPGIVIQAVLATFSVFAVCLALY
ncbi:MAG: Bax inhibitor-1/YccA family protein, partial [Micrococcus sp.]|nr:Bax inhibitor-1/YccA family protein [Micrococcus sp.]